MDEAGRQLSNGAADDFVYEETEGIFISPINGTQADMLWAAAGQASVTGATFLVILIGTWMVAVVNHFQICSYFTIFGMRSDHMAYYVFGVAFPVWILASGVLVGRDLFQWIKLISLMAAAILFAQIKYVFPPADTHLTYYRGKQYKYEFLYSVLGFGILWVNVIEAVVWEATQLQNEPYNFINASSGFIQNICIVAYAKRYGFGVFEDDEERYRELRANLTPLYIIGYSIWNIEYGAVYFPDRAFYYMVVAVLFPLLVAFIGHVDWLEARAQMLLHAICLRLAPNNFQAPTNSALTLYQSMFESEGFRYTMSVLGFLVTIAIAYEAITRVLANRDHFELGGLGSRVIVNKKKKMRSYYGDGDGDDDDEDDDGASFKTGKIMATDV